MLSADFNLVFYAVWLFIATVNMNSAPIKIGFLVFPAVAMLKDFLVRICWRITVNTVEHKFIYHRFLRKTEIFFKKDIIRFVREPIMRNHITEEYLTIQTANRKISIRCTSSGKIYLPFENVYTNLQELTDYLNS